MFELTSNVTKHVLEPPIPGVTVVTGKADRVRPMSIVIAIDGSGRACDASSLHMIQVIARTKFKAESGKFSQATYNNNGSDKRLSRDPNSLEYFLDTASKQVPYYDSDDDPAVFEREGSTLWVTDTPSMGEDAGSEELEQYKMSKRDKMDPEVRKTARDLHLTTLYSEGSKVTFHAYSFCLANNGLLGVVQWTFSREFEKKSAYAVRSVFPLDEALAAGRAALAARNYDPTRYLPNLLIK